MTRVRGVLLGVCVTSFVVVGCATAPAVPPTPSPLVLSGAMLDGAKSDLDDLYQVWIKPHATGDQDTLPLPDRPQLLAAADAVKDGFGRFCAAGGGTLATKPLEFGDELRCTAGNGTFAGRMSIERVKGNLLQVTYESPQRVAAVAAAQRDFEKRKASNGPTGWLVTSEGKIKFLRLGTLAERHALEVEVTNAGETVPIEDIARIDFHANDLNIDVQHRDGRKWTRNIARLAQRSGGNIVSHYGGGKYGLPVVVVDPASGQPYTQLFPNLERLKAIELEPNVASWSALPGGNMQTSFTLASQSGSDRYTQQLRKRATQLYAEAKSSGAIKLLPDGKLTRQLQSHLEDELRRLSSAEVCEGSEVTGILDLDGYARCRVATRELKLVVGSGYSLVAELTPLSTIIVLEKINRDLR